MDFRTTTTSRAESDIRKAANWYDKREPGLGARFYKAVGRGIRVLGTDRVRERGMRRLAVPGFEKYGIFYRVTRDEVKVAAVMHGARHPGRLRMREDEALYGAPLQLD